MSEDLKKMKVTIEGDTKSLKKELGSARAEVKKVTGVFKNAFKLDESQALRSVRSTMQKVKAVVSSVTPKLGFKGKMQEFQIKAGIKVPTEEFQNVENSMDKLQQKVNALLQDEQALSEMGKNQGMSDKYRNLYQSAKEAENALDKLKRKQQELNESGNGTEFTAKYQNAYEQMMNERDRLTSLQKEKNARMAKNLSLSDVTQDGKMINLDEKIAKTQKNIENLAKSMQSLESKGKMEQPTQAAKKLAKQIQAAEDKLGRYKTKMSELTAAGTAYGSDEWIKNQREIQKCTVEMEKLSRVKTNLLNSKEAGQRPISLKSVIGGAAIKGFGGAIKGVGSGVKTLASGVIQKSSGAFGALIQKFSSGIPTLKRARSSFNGLGTSGKGLAGILKTVGMTAKFMFASFVIRGAINGAKQGFQNLAQYSGSTNSSISMLMSSLTQLKNSLAAAFAPILEVVAPILNSFVQMIIRAVNAVGQLIGALTGKTTIVTAKKLNQDYAKSLSGTSSGLADNANNADKASKATEKYKRTIMGFDQINKMDDDSSSDSSGGGSSAGNLGGLSDASNMFQTTTVTNQFKDLAKLIKDAWKNADFTELGSIVGEKLNAALEKIPWKKIQNTCNKIAKSIATFLNGFLETTNWKLVGSTIAKGLNTAFGFVNTFAKNFHWKSLGRAISDGINGAVKSFDAALAGQAISNTVKGILDTIIVAIENTDWQQVGEKVREVLVNIDWKGIVSRLSEAIGAAFGGFAAFIGGLIGDAFTSAKEYFEGKIEECGGNVVLGIFKGIIDAIKGIAAWIKDNIFTPFIDGFKNAFGIHSPSTVMRQQGIYIIEGLLEGAKNKLSDLLSWFGQLPGKIKAKLGDAKAWIKSKGSDAIQGLKSGWEAVKESRFLKYVANMKNEVFTKIGNIKEKVTSKGNDIVSGMKNGFSSHWSSFTETLGNIPSKISKAIPNLFSIGKNAIQGFANGFGSVHIPLPHVSVSWNRHSVGPVSFSTPSFGLNWYAKGGFPENGEMFIARENGPEMVGRMGSRNTVANNNQIIEGIKKGVFEAVVEAFDMSGSMNNDKDKDVIVNLTIKADSETLYKVVRKGQKKYDNRYHVVATI